LAANDNVPEYPELQVHAGAEFELAGHVTRVQTPEKNGEVKVAVMLPENPLLQKQPVGTSTPLLKAGHKVAEQTPLK